MNRAGSVSAHGGGMTTIPGVGRAMVTESNYSDATSGSQVVSTSSATVGAAGLPQATTLDVSGAVYANANAPFWTATVGMSSASATQAAGRWVRIPRSSPAYLAAAADLTMPSLIRDLFHAARYHLGARRTVDGVPTVAITYENTGDDSGSVTCYVGLGAPHLPVLVTIGNLVLHLGPWGKARSVTAPVGAVPLPDASTPSALPVVA